MSSPAAGSLLGTAVGDALGLPYENLSPRRARMLFGEPVRHRLLFGRGMVSDDMEHACLTEWAAHAVALATQKTTTAGEYLELVQARLGHEAKPFLDILERVVRSVEAGESTRDFCRAEGLENGVSGFSLHSVPVALHAWLRNPTDLESAVTEVIRCGGDTDTTAAIAGGIVGAAVGREGIPERVLRTLSEWPRTVGWMERLGEAVDRVAAGQPSECPRLSPISLLTRNLLFLVVVLIHGLRRLLPPY